MVSYSFVKGTWWQRTPSCEKPCFPGEKSRQLPAPLCTKHFSAQDHFQAKKKVPWARKGDTLQAYIGFRSLFFCWKIDFIWVNMSEKLSSSTSRRIIDVRGKGNHPPHPPKKFTGSSKLQVSKRHQKTMGSMYGLFNNNMIYIYTVYIHIYIYYYVYIYTYIFT